MAEVRWTDQAIEDINNIAEYISKDSLTFARIQTDRFFERVEILETQPLAGRIVPELNDQTIRELVMGNYRIVYLMDSEDTATILTVHHSRRQLSNNPAFEEDK
ncbi:MAG: type II toxin-antitoxin system RelE/ParE family toxin [Flavobacteriales bacterium]|nr:type II toxin-antitoxin system RelE/ParE family toxin [Flavobacteriales bacterium]MCB9448042.1 type II toxin-antitoxin system RelE/ParE family toxin [Flavobacteriales bacterium]